MGTVRGRVGYAFDSGPHLRHRRFCLGRQPCDASAPFSDSKFHSGWTAGAGVEVMFAPKWSVKAEYLYRSFQGETYFAGVVPGGLTTGTLNLNSVQVGVNYHF